MVPAEARKRLKEKLQETLEWWEKAAGIGAVLSADAIPAMCEVLGELKEEWIHELGRRTAAGEL